LGEAGGVNLYGFVGNNAINGIDPLGLKSMMALPKHPDYDKWPDDVKKKWNAYQASRMITPDGIGGGTLIDGFNAMDSYLEWRQAYDEWKEEQEQIKLMQCH
jgi:hypothetical protein